MESQRQLKVAKLIQKDLSDIFQKDMKEVFGSAFVTITHAKVSPDFSVATIYLSFILTNDPAGLLADIQENYKKIRMALANKVRHQMRVVPELRFFIDNSAEEATRIAKLIDALDIPKLRNDDEDEGAKVVKMS
jgi:ribosome-binding factor A